MKKYIISAIIIEYAQSRERLAITRCLIGLRRTTEMYSAIILLRSKLRLTPDVTSEYGESFFFEAKKVMIIVAAARAPSMPPTAVHVVSVDRPRFTMISTSIVGANMLSRFPAMLKRLANSLRTVLSS